MEERNWLCEVCGKTLRATAFKAHELGWDTPPYFTGYTKCDECPINGTAIWMEWTGALDGNKPRSGQNNERNQQTPWD